MHTDLTLIQIASAIKSLNSSLCEQIFVTIPASAIGALISAAVAWYIHYKSTKIQLYIYKQSHAQKVREEFLKWFDELCEINLIITDAHQNIEQHIFQKTFETLPSIINEHIHNIIKLQKRGSIFIVDDELIIRTHLLVTQLHRLYDAFKNFENSSEFNELNTLASSNDVTKEYFASSINIQSENKKIKLNELKKQLQKTASEIQMTMESDIIRTYKDTDLIMRRMR